MDGLQDGAHELAVHAHLPGLPGAAGTVAAVLYALSNLPFILIQRYNRPRLARLYRRLMKQPPQPAVGHPSAQPIPAQNPS